MIIRCYGARGSIPVSGESYLKYGGDTTCLEIRTKNDEIIIVDAGSGIRRLGNKLLNEKRYSYHLLFTHSHTDHILGFPFFKPIYYDRTTIQLLGCPSAQGDLKYLLTKSMNAPFFPVQFDKLKARIHYNGACPVRFKVDSVEISHINLSHPNLGMGYKFVEDDKVFVFLTDNELAYQHPGGLRFSDYADFASGADLLIHDAEYTPEQYKKNISWGHSSYTDALRLGISSRVKRLGLFHHNQDRTDAELDAIVEECRNTIEKNACEMDCFALTQNMEISL